MKNALLFLFFCLFPVLAWSQDNSKCDSLFFTDGTKAVVDDIKTVKEGILYRLSRKGYFITENYLLPGTDSQTLILSAGGRWVSKRIAIDFALVRPFITDLEGGNFIGIPWLSITAPFGSKG
jgi:hypothetical protein